MDGNTYVVRGEPEYTMLELVKALEAKSIINGTKSVSFRAKGEITHNANRTDRRPRLTAFSSTTPPGRKGCLL